MSEYSLKPGFVASETAPSRPPAIPPPTVTATPYTGGGPAVTLYVCVYAVPSPFQLPEAECR